MSVPLGERSGASFVDPELDQYQTTVDQPYGEVGVLPRDSTNINQDTLEAVRFAWLEVTGNCQEQCGHCYAESGPEGTHGTMTVEDWKRSIDQLSEQGTDMVQFIGGEPTLYPELTELIDHALKRNMKAEVFSNLVRVTDNQWESFRRPGVSLATSYYSADPAVHSRITQANTHNPIRKNIQKATELGIPLRVGVIGVELGQDISGAITELQTLGVSSDAIGVDYMRQVGRGVRNEVTPETTSQLCGNCADGVVAVMPDGSVQPCVFSRQPEFTIGNVTQNSVGEIVASDQFTSVRGLLRTVFSQRGDPASCRPDCSPRCSPELGSCSPDCRPSHSPCAPDACQPQCSPNTQPCNPYDCRPTRTGDVPDLDVDAVVTLAVGGLKKQCE